MNKVTKRYPGDRVAICILAAFEFSRDYRKSLSGAGKRVGVEGNGFEISSCSGGCDMETSVESGTPSKTILVVEDEPDMSIFLSNLLSAHGFCPVCAATLSEGLRRAVDDCPDLVIINAMLPGEAGVRLYQNLRSDHRLCHIPVVMLSTLDESAYYRWPGTKRTPSGRQLPQPEAFLRQPPEADELLAVVNRLCSGDSCTVGEEMED